MGKILQMTSTGAYRQVDNDHTWVITEIITSDYTAKINELVRCNPAKSAFTINLPTAVDNSGKNIVVKNISKSKKEIKIQPFDKEMVDNEEFVVINKGQDLVRLISDGTNWITW